MTQPRRHMPPVARPSATAGATGSLPVPTSAAPFPAPVAGAQWWRDALRLRLAGVSLTMAAVVVVLAVEAQTLADASSGIRQQIEALMLAYHVTPLTNAMQLFGIGAGGNDSAAQSLVLQLGGDYLALLALLLPGAVAVAFWFSLRQRAAGHTGIAFDTFLLTCSWFLVTGFGAGALIYLLQTTPLFRAGVPATPSLHWVAFVLVAAPGLVGIAVGCAALCAALAVNAAVFARPTPSQRHQTQPQAPIYWLMCGITLAQALVNAWVTSVIGDPAAFVLPSGAILVILLVGWNAYCNG